MRNKYAVIVSYIGAESTGAVVVAENTAEVWKKALELFNLTSLASVQVAEILTDEREAKNEYSIFRWRNK